LLRNLLTPIAQKKPENPGYVFAKNKPGDNHQNSCATTDTTPGSSASKCATTTIFYIVTLSSSTPTHAFSSKNNGFTLLTSY
jgi:hypothetical protein